MGLGIGLGSFMGGVAQGYKVGSGIRDDWKERKKERRLEDINAQGQKDFDALKATDPSAEWDDFYATQVVPNKIREYQAQGDDKTAFEYKTWADSDAAKRGGKLFASGLIKGQNGDVMGAMGDFVEAGKTKGYLDHSFTIGGTKELKDYDGNITGYQIDFTDGKGKKQQHIFKTAEEVLDFGATFVNPDAAYQTWQQRREGAAKSASDFEKRRAELGLKREDDQIRKDTGLAKGGEDPGKVYDSALKTASEAMDWDTLDDDSKKERVQKIIDDRNAYIESQGGDNGGGGGGSVPGIRPAPGGAGGRPAVPGARQVPTSRVIIDTETGETVAGGEPSEEAPAEEASTEEAPAEPKKEGRTSRILKRAFGNLASGPSGPKVNVFDEVDAPPQAAPPAPGTGFRQAEPLAPPARPVQTEAAVQPVPTAAAQEEAAAPPAPRRRPVTGMLPAQALPPQEQARGRGDRPGLHQAEALPPQEQARGKGDRPGLHQAEALPPQEQARGKGDRPGLHQAEALTPGIRPAQALPSPRQAAAEPGGPVEGTMPIRDPELEALRQQLPAAQQRVLDAAARAMRNGINPRILAPQLQNAGIPAELWPF